MHRSSVVSVGAGTDRPQGRLNDGHGTAPLSRFARPPVGWWLGRCRRSMAATHWRGRRTRERRDAFPPGGALGGAQGGGAGGGSPRGGGGGRFPGGGRDGGGGAAPAGGARCQPGCPGTRHERASAGGVAGPPVATGPAATSAGPPQKTAASSS